MQQNGNGCSQRVRPRWSGPCDEAKQIIVAYELNLHETTVHIRNIMKKLKARNWTEVAFMTNELVQNAAPFGLAAERCQIHDDTREGYHAKPLRSLDGSPGQARR